MNVDDGRQTDVEHDAIWIRGPRIMQLSAAGDSISAGTHNYRSGSVDAEMAMAFGGLPGGAVPKRC